MNRNALEHHKSGGFWRGGRVGWYVGFTTEGERKTREIVAEKSSKRQIISKKIKVQKQKIQKAKKS